MSKITRRNRKDKEKLHKLSAENPFKKALENYKKKILGNKKVNSCMNKNKSTKNEIVFFSTPQKFYVINSERNEKNGMT